MKTTAIIAAAGLGLRMGAGLPKQYLEIGGRPIICHTLDRFASAKIADDIIIVIEPGGVAQFQEEIISKYQYPKTWRVTEGGKVRQESVTNGLKLVSEDTDVVLVHDGVRPFIKSKLIIDAIQKAFKTGACIIAAPLKETIKKVGADSVIKETVDRENLWGAQTPQVFLKRVLVDAMESANQENFIGTDEASLVERMGAQVQVLEGDSRNIKITTPEDIIIAEAILKNFDMSF